MEHETYKTALLPAVSNAQGLALVDAALNAMSAEGWRLHSIVELTQRQPGALLVTMRRMAKQPRGK